MSQDNKIEEIDSKMIDTLNDLVKKNQENFGEDSNMSERLEDLMKALEAGKYVSSSASLLHGAALKVDDLSEIANKYLSESAKLDIANSVKQLIVTDDEGKTYQSIYFSAVVKTGNEEKGVAAIAKVINDLSQHGLIHSCLAPMSSLQLAVTSSVPKSVVFCFPHVPSNCVKDCEARYKELFTLEGGVGPEVEDTSVPLAEGEFLAEIRVTHSLALLKQAGSTQERIKREINKYLKFLPEGTEVVQVTEIAISDLSYPVEVKFKHPEMHDVSKVELDYVRCVRRVADGIEQYNRYTGIKYFDRSGKEMYNYDDVGR